MKITVNQKELTTALKAIKPAVLNRSTLLILSGVKIAAQEGDDYITIDATDLEIACTLTLPATVEDAGSTVVALKPLTDAVALVDADDVVLVKDDEKPGHTNIMEPGGIIELRDMPPVDFPKRPTLDAKTHATITAPHDFAKAAMETAEAASTDETRPVLCAVLMREVGDGLHLVATDSYRMHLRAVEGFEGTVTRKPTEDEPKVQRDCLVPGRAIEYVAKLIGKKSCRPVSVTRSENRIRFGFAVGGMGVMVTFRLVLGQFPNYEQLLPATCETTATTDRAKLEKLVKKVGKFALHSSPIRLELNGKGILRSATQDVGGMSYDFAVDKEGKDVETAVNAEFFERALKNMTSEQVVLELVSPLRPLLIKPSVGSVDCALIMPVRIS